MNNQPPAGSFETQTRGFAQPRVVNIVTQGIPLSLENRDREEWRVPLFAMRKTFGRKSREKVEHPSARMMPNQKKNCREVCVQAQKLLEEKKRRERREERPGTRRPKGMGDPGRGAFLPSPWLPGSSFVYSGHGSFLLCSEATVVEVVTEMGRSSRETDRSS